MIDSHCHLDVGAFDADRDAVLARARGVGVTDLVVPAVDPPSWQAIRELCARTALPRCHVAIGVHPVALPLLAPAGDAAMLAAFAAEARRPGTVAVGECGLDTTVDLQKAPLVRQEWMLRVQLDVARTLDLPVILHARGPGSYALLLAFLKAEQLPAAGGVVHSYGGGVDLLKGFLALPLSFGFAGPATYPGARKVRASIAAVPDERLLAETDAPDQTPEPHRPGRSEPAYVACVVAGLAAARGATPEHVAAVTGENARRLFRI